MCDGNDWDGPSLFKEKKVIARKSHQCCECNCSIAPGEKYQIISRVWDGEWSHFKTCLTCAETRDKAQSLNYGCIILGQLYETIEFGIDNA